MEWASNLQGAKGLPNPNVSRTSDPPNRAYMSSAPPNLFDNNLESPRRLSEQTSDISHFDLRGGPTISPTSGMEWASNLQGAKGLPNVSRTSDLPNRAFMSSAPPNLFDNNLESSRRSSEQTSDISHFDSRPNQMRMCYASIFFTFMIPIPSEIAYRMLGMSSPPSISKGRQILPYLWTQLCC